MLVKDLLQKGFWTLLARSLGAGLMLSMTILFARWLGAADFGLFSLGLTIMTIMSVMALWGNDQIILKQVGIHWKQNNDTAKGYIVSALMLVLIIGIIVVCIIFLLKNVIANEIFNKPNLDDVLFYFGLLIIPFSLNYIASEFFKGSGNSVISTLLQNITIPMVTLLISFVFIITGRFDLTSAIYSFSIGVVVSFLFTSVFLFKKIGLLKVRFINLGMVFSEGQPMFLASVGALIMVWSDIIVLGVYSTPEELGVYSAASRVALILTLVLTAVNSITAPKFAKFYKDGDLSNIGGLAKMSTRLLIIINSIFLLILIALSEFIMGGLGSEFASGWSILIILAVGQFFNGSFSSLGYMLTMTGRESHYKKILLLTAISNVTISVIAIQFYGPTAVAVITTVSIIFWILLANHDLKKHINISIFKIF